MSDMRLDCESLVNNHRASNNRVDINIPDRGCVAELGQVAQVPLKFSFSLSFLYHHRNLIDDNMLREIEHTREISLVGKSRTKNFLRCGCATHEIL